MEKIDIIERDLGPETKLRVSFDDGMIKLNVDQVGTIGGSGAYLIVDAAKLIDAVTDAIPGEWDDLLIDDLVVRMLSKKTAE